MVLRMARETSNSIYLSYLIILLYRYKCSQPDCCRKRHHLSTGAQFGEPLVVPLPKLTGVFAFPRGFWYFQWLMKTLRPKPKRQTQQAILENPTSTLERMFAAGFAGFRRSIITSLALCCSFRFSSHQKATTVWGNNFSLEASLKSLIDASDGRKTGESLPVTSNRIRTVFATWRSDEANCVAGKLCFPSKTLTRAICSKLLFSL